MYLKTLFETHTHTDTHNQKNLRQIIPVYHTMFVIVVYISSASLNNIQRQDLV